MTDATTEFFRELAARGHDGSGEGATIAWHRTENDNATRKLA